MSLPVLYLNYHEVRAEASPHMYCLRAEEFDAHVRALGAPPPGSRAGLGVTFDDGHCTQFEQAFPVLTRHGIPAIFFVTAGFTETRPDYMSWAQLRELAAAGHQVQAHGWMHRFMTHCTDAELDEELCRPKETIESHLGQPVDALSFPGGRYDARVLEACRRVGYRRVFTSATWPLAWEEHGLQVFGRYGIQRRHTVATLARLMRTGGRPSVLQRLGYSAKMKLREAIGDERYHRMWCLLSHRDPGAEQNTPGSGR
jgi:peptidoglycan/xylan/chitin deacetylase (PgdA/CDA1 family)